MLRPLLSLNIRTYDTFYPGIIDVIYCGIDPVQALTNAKAARWSCASQEEIDVVVAKLLAGMEKAEAPSRFETLLAKVEAGPDGIMLSMKELVTASGQRRAGRRIVQAIEERLRAKGLCHEPVNLPHSQSVIVRLFKRSNNL